MTVRLYPISHPLQPGQILLGGRAPFNPRLALPVRFPVKLEPQKVKPPVVGAAIGPEAQRLGLIRRYFQPKFGQPFFQCPLKGLGFMSILKAHYEIIRIADD